MDLYLGIDIGTGSCKSSLITREGKLVGIGKGNYFPKNETPNLKEQTPDSIINGMIKSVLDVQRKIDTQSMNIQAISIGSALHGLLAVDKNGNPLTNVITWADDRSFSQANKIRESELFSELYQQTGCPSHGMYPLYKIIWLRENKPEVFNKTAKFISIKEYIIKKLCGEYLVDHSLASGTGLLNIHSRQWNKLSLDLAGIYEDQLSYLESSRKNIPITGNDLSGKLNLKEKIPLILGSSDAGNSNIGSGSVLENQATCMIGTSGAYRIISPVPILDASAGNWCYCFDDEKWLVGGAINNGGLAISWLKDVLQSVTEENLSFDQILLLAEKSEIGGNGVFCLPFFAGERSPNWNLDSRAVFFGLSLEHGLHHIARSIVEGISFRLRSIDEIFSELDIDIKEIRSSGGYTKSKFWVQLLSDVLGRPIIVPEEGETSCYGAALWCYLALNKGAKLADVGYIIKTKDTISPNEKNHKAYNKLYAFYNKIYQSISPLFGQLKEFQSDN